MFDDDVSEYFGSINSFASFVVAGLFHYSETPACLVLRPCLSFPVTFHPVPGLDLLREHIIPKNSV